jgi:hypothetical protein
MGGVSDRIFIEFFLEENGETILFYTLYLRGSSWKEKWHDDVAEKELRTGRSIKEFDALLGKYLDSQGIEQFRAWHPSIGTILVSLTVQDSYNLETLSTIGDELVDFLVDNRQELVDKYSRYSYLYGWVHIYINFCSKDGTRIFSIINGYNGPGKDWRWERHWFY